MAFCTTESYSVLQNRILFLLNEIFVRQNQILYYRVEFCTTSSNSVLQNRISYYGIEFCTTDLNSLLQNRLPSYRIEFCTTKSISCRQACNGKLATTGLQRQAIRLINTASAIQNNGRQHKTSVNRPWSQTRTQGEWGEGVTLQPPGEVKG